MNNKNNINNKNSSNQHNHDDKYDKYDKIKLTIYKISLGFYLMTLYNKKSFLSCFAINLFFYK
jgi:hypothetical protein